MPKVGSSSYDHPMGTYEVVKSSRATTIAALCALSLLTVTGCGVDEQTPKAASETAGATGAATAGPEVVDSAEPTAQPLDLELDSASVIQAGEGDFSTLNTIGWPGTDLQPGDYTVHVQCRGTEALTFAYTSEARPEGMSHLPCGAPQSFDISVQELGYYVTLSGNPASTSNVEYVFAVTHQAS